MATLTTREIKREGKPTLRVVVSFPDTLEVYAAERAKIDAGTHETMRISNKGRLWIAVDNGEAEYVPASDYPQTTTWHRIYSEIKWTPEPVKAAMAVPYSPPTDYNCDDDMCLAINQSRTNYCDSTVRKILNAPQETRVIPGLIGAWQVLHEVPPPIDIVLRFPEIIDKESVERFSNDISDALAKALVNTNAKKK